MSALCTHSYAEYLHLRTRVQTQVNRDYAVDLPLQRFGYCVKMLAFSVASFIFDFLFTPQEFRDKTVLNLFQIKLSYAYNSSCIPASEICQFALIYLNVTIFQHSFVLFYIKMIAKIFNFQNSVLAQTIERAFQGKNSDYSAIPFIL